MIGGRFDSVDGRPARNIAYWNGKEWNQLGEGLDMKVLGLACSKNTIYACGTSDRGPTSDFYVKKWDKITWTNILPEQWFYRQEFKMTSIDSILVIQGNFGRELQGNQIQALHFGKWNGNEWECLDTLFKLPPKYDPYYYEITYQGMVTMNHKVYFCGNFDSVAGIYAPRIAGWDGKNWFRLPGYEVLGTQLTQVNILRSVGNKLFATGTSSFTANNGTLRAGSTMIFDGIKWDTTKGEPLPLTSEFAGDDSHIFVSNPGTFFNVNQDVKYMGLAEYKNGQFIPVVDSSQLGAGYDEPGGPESAVVVSSIAQVGKKIYACTSGALGLHEADDIMVWNNGHWEKTDFFDSVRSSIGGAITGIFGKGDSLFISGGFRQFGKEQTDGLVMFDGKHWNMLHDSLFGTVNQYPDHPTVDKMGRIYTEGLMMWADSQWIKIPPPTGNYDHVSLQKMTAGVDGIFAAFLYYDKPGDELGTDILKWDGIQWSSMTNEKMVRWYDDTSVGYINFMKYDNGKLIVSGYFGNIESIEMTNIGYWGDSLWHSFGKGIYLDPNRNKYGQTSTGAPLGAVAFDGGDLYYGGIFSHADSSEALSIARWDGSSWHPLGSGLRFKSAGNVHICGNVTGMAIVDQKLYVSGGFASAGNKPAYNFTYYSLPTKSIVHQIKNNTIQSSIFIFPDPANNFITVSFNSPDEKILKAEIIDELGNAAKSIDLKNKDVTNSMQFDTHDLQAGIYFIRLFTANGIISQKFLIAK
ncbi:MAG: T9SS type A sorting domain-containing protein [Candidatus Kapaibacterium sp.]